jgi:hypothetical protein
MAYPEKSPILDFAVVDMHNTLTLGVADVSFYPENFNVVNPTFEITPPAFVKATVTYTVGNLNVFNSNTLNITCVSSVDQLVDLPDGIWTIRQSIAPAINYNLERTFMRTTLIEQKLGKAFLKTDITQCNQDMKIEEMKIIDQIYYYIQASVAAANQCNNILAMNLYRAANTMLDNFLADKCTTNPARVWY